MKTRETAILSAGIVLAAFIFGIFFLHARTDQNTIRVVGSASHSFSTDIVKWQLNIARTTSQERPSGGYANLRADLKKIIGTLEETGIDRTEITIQPVTSQPVYDHQGAITSYRVQQSLYVISDQVAVIEDLALNPESIYSQGIIVQQSQLQYYYSAVDELKHELLGKAAKDARMRAEEIASSSDGSVGIIKTEKAGVFQITEPYSTEVSGYGMYNTSSRQKDIKVTVHAEFYLN